jgi:hypothetical protein
MKRIVPRPADIEILQEIDYYDGPTIFVGIINSKEMLFWGSEREAKYWSYLAIPNNAGLIEGLSNGTITMREAYGNVGTWLVDLDGWKITRIQEFTEPTPEKYLCAEGVSLKP